VISTTYVYQNNLYIEKTCESGPQAKWSNDLFLMLPPIFKSATLKNNNNEINVIELYNNNQSSLIKS